MEILEVDNIRTDRLCLFDESIQQLSPIDGLVVASKIGPVGGYIK
jgi:hypothetical protein